MSGLSDANRKLVERVAPDRASQSIARLYPELLNRLLDAAREEGPGWRDIATYSPPLDGKPFEVWGRHFKWPEVVMWKDHDPDTAAEIGEPGYWVYAEEQLADVVDDLADDAVALWTHWRQIVGPHRRALSTPTEGEEHD